MKNKLKAALSILALLFALITCEVLQAQPRGVLEVLGRMESDNKPITNGVIKIYLNNAVAEVHNTNMLGRFEIYLQYDREFIVEFSSPGLIKKRIAFDTRMPERASRRAFRDYSFSVDLFPYVEEIDLSFFEEDLITIKYNERRGEFAYVEVEANPRLRKASNLKQQVLEFIVKKEHYDRLISQADQQFNEDELRVARESYIAASAILPQIQYPKDRIEIINELLAQRDARERRVLDLLFAAEELIEQDKHDEANAKMNEAIAVDPNDSSIRGRVDALRQVQIQYRQLSGNYHELIKRADEAFDNAHYGRARDFYRQALDIRPEEEYPKNRIEEINILLAELREIELKYNEAIEKADNYYRVLNYEDALKHYQEALTYKPDEEHPRERIEVINRHLFSLQQREEQYNAAIELGETLYEEKEYERSLEAFRTASGLKPNEEYPKEKITEITRLIRELADKQRRYNRSIEEGDQAFNIQRYANALVSYRTASEIYPEEEYPKEMLAKINEILMDQAERNAKYNEFIQKADAAYDNRVYQDARSNYQEALLLKPEERHPAQRIEEIGKILAQQDIDTRYASIIQEADEKFNEKLYENALTLYREATRVKPNESHPRRRINEISEILERMRAIDEQYANTIAFADRAFDNKEYGNAKESYQRALGFKPDEPYPKDKINQIDQILADMATEDKYSRAINEADNAFNDGDCDQAIAKYREALQSRPDEPYPTGKIAECERILADKKELESKYNEAIAEGNRAFNRRAWDNAMTQYQTALELKPNEQYPRSRIDEINLLLAQQRSVDMQYNNLLKEAEEAFNENNYPRAITLYESALQLKPDEDFPKQQIDMINSLIAEQRRMDEEYREAIANADRLFLNRAYQRSKEFYETASSIKSNEEYPRNRIEEIDRILLRQLGVEQAYKNAIADADRLFNQQDYIRARETYRRALSIKSNETYPRNRITEIEGILSSMAGESAGYNAAINAGDTYFTQRQFFRARDAYQQALSIRPSEEYPQRRIIEINEIIAKSTDMDAFYNRGFMDVSNVREIIKNNVEKRYFFVPFDRRRTGSYLMVRGENLSERNIRLFINYGKDRTRFGGFTVTIGSEEGIQEMKIDISNQRRWISDDCNWISIYPQGGDLEVMQLQLFFGP